MDPFAFQATIAKTNYMDATSTTNTAGGNDPPSGTGVIGRRELRRCLAQFATGVTVVGCRAGHARHGATVNAFTAVSLDPPLILVAVDRRSRPWASYDGGDHTLYLGEVREFGYQADAEPLLFHSGQYRSLGAPLGAAPWAGTLDSPETTW